MNTAPWRFHLPAAILLAYARKGATTPPPGGWTARTFARHGRGLMAGLARIGKLTQKQAAPHLARLATTILREQMEAIIARAHRKLHLKSTMPPVLFDMGAHENLWAQAIEEVLREQGDEVVMRVVPPIQSVIAAGQSRTADLLGLDLDRSDTAWVTHRASEIGRRIVGINRTTREKFQTMIKHGLDEGFTSVDMAEYLRTEFDDWNRARIATIARTEMNNAWTRGSVRSIQASDTVTHVSVIGCESREEWAWGYPSYQQFMYRGESTCNAEDVPVHDADKLNFHPNHTGTVVPSGFRDVEGMDVSED